MSRFDIRFWKCILVGGGVLITISELCLLAHQWLTGCSWGFPAWVRIVIALVGLGVAVVAMAVKVEV